ncbi:MAG: ribosome assembly cofactor RimP [Treponema sp.]|nr:ribosome assembly cofactor RimP [Treponema sp.]
MQYSLRKRGRDSEAPLEESLGPLVRALGMSLIEVSLYKGRQKGSVQVRLVVLSPGAEGSTGLEDCSRVHRAVMPRLELAFPGQEIYLEVSSPGIDRLIKDGSELAHYLGRGIRCYRTDISDWSAGRLVSVNEEEIVLHNEEGDLVLPLEVIAKARLYSAPLGGAALRPVQKNKTYRS